MNDDHTTAVYVVSITLPPDCGDHLTTEEVKGALYEVCDMDACIEVECKSAAA